MPKIKPKYSIGEKCRMKYGEVRIMAYSEGYYMVRYKGSAPFVTTEENLYPI